MAVLNREKRSKNKSKEDARRQIHRTSQSEAFPEDRSIRPANQKRFQKIKPNSVLSNQIILAGHTSRTHPHTDHLLSCPIRFLQTDFRQTIFRFVQSYSFGQTSDGPSSVSSNQIPLDGLQTDHLPSRPIRFLRTDFRH